MLNNCLLRFYSSSFLRLFTKNPLQEGGAPNKEEKTKFTELNEDCHSLIFEFLDLTDLLNLIQTNHELSIMANEQFRRRFSKKEIQILDEKSKPRNRRPQAIYDNGDLALLLQNLLENNGNQLDQHRNDQVRVSNDHVEIYDFDLTLDILKHFGHLIQKLSIKSSIKSSKWDTVSQFINEYCAESLVGLELSAISHQNSLAQFTGIFKSVNDLTIRIANEYKNVQTFNKTFPHCQRLSLEMVFDSDHSFIDCTLPNLKHLAIEMYSDVNEITIEKLMHKNSQIQSLELNNISVGFVKKIENLLPSLKRLTLSLLNLNEETIHFEHVQEFYFKTAALEWLPTQISFTNLRSLRLLYSHNDFDQWLNFVKMNRNVSRLKIYIGSVDFSNKQLENITAELPHLTEMTVETSFYIKTTAIVRLIENNTNLRKFKYIFHDAEENVLREFLEAEWKISIENNGDFKIFTFQRRLSQVFLNKC